MARSEYTVPVSWEESRERFRGRLAEVQTLWPEARLQSRVIDGTDGLTIDWIEADARQARERLFLLTTGLHGIEGYFGAVMLDLFLTEFLPRMEPSTTGLALVHCINPWGMRHWQRNNPANADLNRNFLTDFEAMKSVNPDYSLLDWFFNPRGPVGAEWPTKLRFFLRLPGLLRRYGAVRIREAALMGQYRNPRGMYGGGLELQPETRFMMELFERLIPAYDQTLHLDMHTGYGPRHQMTLVQTGAEKMTSAEAMARFGLPRVAAANPDEFYQMHGEMADFLYAVAHRSARRLYSAAFEFGTYGDGLLQGARSLLTSIVGNQLRNYGASPRNRAWVERDFRALYLPADRRWFEKALHDGRAGFAAILQAEGFLRP